MAKKANNKPSQEVVDEAMQITLATQRPKQTKEQSKLIAQGIEKGIALYKKQQKEKVRSANKAKKQSLKNNAKQVDASQKEHEKEKVKTYINYLPWVISITSWVILGGYMLL